MLELISIKFNNIGKYIVEQDITFEGREKLLLIEGKSGIGKSTIFNAIDYLFGVSDIPSTVLQCRNTKTSIYVEGTFRINNETVTIKRSKKDGLIITTPTEKISGNVDQGEEMIDKLVGMPRKLLKQLIHKPQKEGGFFLKMTAKEVYNFLIELLGLKHYQDKIEKISIQISELEKKNELFQFSHDSLTKNITDLQSLNEQPPTKPDYTDEEITVGNEEIKKLEGQLRALQNELFAKTSELIKPIKQSASFDSSKILRLSSEINSLKNNRTSIINLFMTTKQDLQKNISKFQYAISDIKRARNDAQRISLEVAKLQNEKELVSKSICPTCSQTWVGVQVAAKVKAVEDSIKLNINKILELKNVIDQEAVIEAQIIDLQNQLNVLTVPDTLEIDNKIKELEIIYIAEKSAEQSFLKTIENKYLQEYSAYQESNRLISNHYNMEIQEVTKKLNDIKNAVMTVTRALDYYQRSVNEYNSRLARNQQLVTAKTQELNVLITSNEAIKKKLLVAQEAKRLIKSYTLRIFQETLDTIGETASRIIGNVDNLTNCTIYFEGCKETKSGTIKDEVNPIVNFEGENDVPIKSLSGGQRTVVDLAVDLAVIDVIESKTGKGVCWFAIEEPFEGLAEDNKEQILQMLTQMHLNKQIILVDHSPVVKSIVRDQIHII